MNLKSDTLMLINLLVRICLLIYLPKENEVEKGNIPQRYWMEPVSDKVFLIFINGLQRDFVKYNSTPFLSEMIENVGSFGITQTGSLETNFEGMWTVLSGKYSPQFSYPFFTKHNESISDYIEFTCGIGDVRDMQLLCNYQDDHPFININKIITRSLENEYMPSLFIITLNLDPIWEVEYKKKLNKIDTAIHFLAVNMNEVFKEWKTTFIVTSARGTPLDSSWSTDTPVIAWGNGIVNNRDTTVMSKSDLTAMICVLLGVNFPSEFFGVPPVIIMDMKEYLEYEVLIYTVRHFERVLELVEPKNFLLETPELDLEDLYVRIDQIIRSFERGRYYNMLVKCFWVIHSFILLGINFAQFLSSGVAKLNFSFKKHFFILIVVCITFMFYPSVPVFPVLFELGLFWTWQNFDLIINCIFTNIIIFVAAIALGFMAVLSVVCLGNSVALPVFFLPILIFPVIDGSYRRLNGFVLLTHLFSGTVLCLLPFFRVLGVAPDYNFVMLMNFLLLGNSFVLLYAFKREIEMFFNINFFLVLATALLLYCRTFVRLELLNVLLYVIIGFFIMSLFSVSGTLMSRLHKIFVSLIIPVVMLTVRNEIMFYFCIIFNLFSWIFIEYHRTSDSDIQFNPPIFSVEPKWSDTVVKFSFTDFRQIIFFVIYCYHSYFAMGSHPDLISYDFYVLPAFVYWYPSVISYFLAFLRFFLPFFVVTVSFIVVCLVKEKDFKPMIIASVWFSDTIACFLILYTQVWSGYFSWTVSQSMFSYIIIHQAGVASVILSYFLGKYLLLGSENPLQMISRIQKLFS